MRVVRGAALLPVTHHRSLRPQVFRPVDRTIAQRKDECGSIMAMLCCALVAVALEVFNTGKAGVDAGAGMRGVGWISVCVCLKSDGIVFHIISFYLIIIIAVSVSLSTHLVLPCGWAIYCQLQEAPSIVPEHVRVIFFLPVVYFWESLILPPNLPALHLRCPLNLSVFCWP